MPPSTNYDIESAETLALKAVNFILADENLQQGFMATSGIAPEDFKALLGSPDFLGGVLDFLLGNEEQLIKFCEEYEINPADPARARHAFPGAVLDYWSSCWAARRLSTIIPGSDKLNGFCNDASAPISFAASNKSS